MPYYHAQTVGRGVVLNAPSSDGSNGQALITDGSKNLSFATVTTNPAGSDTQLQFNNAGVFGASSLLTFDGDTLAVSGANTAAPVLQVTMPAAHADNAIEVLDSVGNELVGFAPGAFSVKCNATDSLPMVRSISGNTLDLQGKGDGNGPQLRLAGNGITSQRQWSISRGDGDSYICSGNGWGAGSGWIFVGGGTSSMPTGPNGNTATLSIDTANESLYLGACTNASPHDGSINGEGGLGTDIAGGTLTIAGGKGTGAGAGGAVKLQVAPAGTTGSSLNSLVDVLTIDETDQVKITGLHPTTPAVNIVAGDANGCCLGFSDSTGTLRGGIRQNTTATFISSNWANNHAEVQLSGANGYEVLLNTIQGNSYFSQSGTYGARFKHGSAITGQINSDGMYVTGQNTANPVFQINMPAAHADNAIEVLDSVGAETASFSPTGCAIRGSASSYYPQLSINGTVTQIRGDGSSSGAYVEVNGTGKWSLANGEQSQWWTNGQGIGGGTNFILGGHNSSPATNPTGSTNAFSLDCANRVLHIGPTKNATPTDSYLRGVGGVGTDIGGADLYIDAGAGTGAATGGSVLIRSAQAGVSGTTLQSWSTVLEIAADDKIGAFGVPPVVQPSGTGETVGFTAGSGTGVNDDSTFTGNLGSTAYRINDIVKALKLTGWMAL